MATKINKSSEQTFAFAGGVVGLVSFLVVGLLPALVYGGYAGVVLASATFGGPIHENLAAQATVVFGIVVGVLATAGLFTLIGAALGAGLGSVLGVRVRRSEANAETTSQN